MLIISKELRDQINTFLGGIQVPVSIAPNFLVVIKALNELPDAEQKAEVKKGKK